MTSHLEAALERRTRAPRAPNLVLCPSPDELGTIVDWSSFHLSARPADKLDRDATVVELSAALGGLIAERGWHDVVVGSALGFAWVEADPLVRAYPDVYLLEGASPEPEAELWRVWEPGRRPPWVAVELVSAEWQSDYDLLPQKYAQLGAIELVIFDADRATALPRSGRVPLQVFRRTPDGLFLCVHSSDGPAWCDELEVWLQVLRSDVGVCQLRLSYDRAGREPVLAPASRAPLALEAERQQLEVERRELDEQRRELDAERRSLDAERRSLDAERARLQHRRREL